MHKHNVLLPTGPARLLRLGAAGLALLALSMGCGHGEGRLDADEPSPEGGPAPAAPVITRHHRLTRAPGLRVPVLSRESFARLYGDNPEVPKTSADVIALARRLRPGTDGPGVQEECGEHPTGLLLAALGNPDLPDEVRELVDVDAAPVLPSVYTSGHFRFYYTTGDANPDHNVTLAEIISTAAELNAAWNDYASSFKEPKHYVSDGVKLIDVKVYYLGAGLFGQTNSAWNHIELNSKLVVKDACKRQTTPAHELFHRVQYAYGYTTGAANMRWATEGTAAWSQKRRASHVGDWMERMNEGLSSPDVQLISRSYDALPFWIYLGRRGGGEQPSIRDAWQAYQVNGFNMPGAVDTVVKSRIGAAFSRDWFVEQWHNAGSLKDLANATALQDYEEDEWTRVCNGTTYGPLSHVPRTAVTLSIGTNDTRAGSATAYGSDYFVYNIGAGVRRVELSFSTLVAGFAYTVVEIKGTSWTSMTRSLPGRQSFTYSKTFAPGDITQLQVIVGGNPPGGAYSVNGRGFAM